MSNCSTLIRGLKARKPDILFTMTGACGVSGGIAAVNLNILRALVSLAESTGISVTVLSLLEKERDRPDFLSQSVNYTSFCGDKFALAASLLRFTRNKPIYFFERVGLSVPVLPLAAANAVETIVFAHGSENWRCVRKIDRWSIQVARAVLTNSEYTLRKMRENLPHFNRRACPLGLSPAFALNEEMPSAPSDSIALEASDGRKYMLGNRVLLLVARMHPAERQKGHYPLLEVFPALREKYPDVQLVFPGQGDDRRNLEGLAERKGVAASVFFPGHASIQLLEQLYRHCYAFVMPSKQEGFGLVYLEAMNYAKPCVGCFDDGTESVIVHGETGCLVRDPSNSQELLALLCALLNDPEHARTLGQRGFERLHAHFTAEHFQARLKEEIVRLL